MAVAVVALLLGAGISADRHRRYHASRFERHQEIGKQLLMLSLTSNATEEAALQSRCSRWHVCVSNRHRIAAFRPWDRFESDPSGHDPRCLCRLIDPTGG
jgi:hypothetical protein